MQAISGFGEVNRFLEHHRYYSLDRRLLLYPIQPMVLEFGTSSKEATPGSTPDAVGLPHNGLFVQRAH